MKNEIEIPINLTNLSEAIKMARELNQLLDSAKAKIDGLKESFPDFRIPADIDESVIGQNIKKIRKKQGLTQKELGERLGITQQTVAQYERATERTYRGVNTMGYGKNLKEILKEKGMKVPELSRRTNIPQTTIYSIINKDINIMQWAKQKGFSTDFAFDPKREHQKVLFVGVAKNLARSFYPEDFAQIKQSVYKQLDEMCIYKEGV